MLEYITHNAEETIDLGYRLGSVLQGGDIVCLTGGLGTGKTAFTGGIARAAGVAGYVTSPTFTIVNEYQGAVPLYHFDVYRINDPDEMFEIGFDEYIEGSGIVVIEWAELISGILPEDHIGVRFERGDLADDRRITIEFKGKKYEQYEGKSGI